MTRLVVLFHRLGPYHQARLCALASRCRLTALEFSDVDTTYAWSKIESTSGFARAVLFEDADVDAIAKTRVLRRAHDALADLDPEVVAIPGWSQPAALAALLWCLRRQRPAVLMSDSTEHDQIRRPLGEMIKRRVVRLFGAAMVAGTPQRAYAGALGLPAGRIFCGYDVVDNDHFERGAQRARACAAEWRARLGLPGRFFLACSRLVEKKNLVRLLEAYTLYRARAAAPWRLVILGDGDLRSSLVGRIDALGIAADVLLPGFKQYDELPIYYGLAGAFVHASTTEQWGLVVNEAMASGLPVVVSDPSGCVPDLVQNGVNGFTFEPHDVGQLARSMQRVATMTDDQRSAMGRAGQRIVADWGPERFADGLMHAVETAMSQLPSKATSLDKALLWALIRR